jgi:predicted nucleotidyltransferase
MHALLQTHLPQVKNLMRYYGVNRAFAFGSAVKGPMHEDSDVDFIISFPESMDYETYANNYFALANALEDLLKKNVDLVTEKTLKNPFLLESIDSHKVQVL